MSVERATSRGATSFADLNQLLARFVDGVREVLGDVMPEQQADLDSLHQSLYALPTPWAQHLEGSYVPRHVLRRPDPERRPLLYGADKGDMMRCRDI